MCAWVLSAAPAWRTTREPCMCAQDSYGPFQANSRIDVPLWLALLLHKRKKCTILQPLWMDKDNLTGTPACGCMCRHEPVRRGVNTHGPAREAVKRHKPTKDACAETSPQRMRVQHGRGGLSHCSIHLALPTPLHACMHACSPVRGGAHRGAVLPAAAVLLCGAVQAVVSERGGHVWGVIPGGNGRACWVAAWLWTGLGGCLVRYRRAGGWLGNEEQTADKRRDLALGIGWRQ